MIETIRLSGVATYAPEAQSLHGLKKVNYFYGANGSGKTTVSRLIADPLHPDYSLCSLTWNAGRPIGIAGDCRCWRCRAASPRRQLRV